MTMTVCACRVAEEFMLHVGAAVGYWQGDARKLLDDVHLLRPTVFCGVPRVFERVYNGVMDKVGHSRTGWQVSVTLADNLHNMACGSRQLMIAEFVTRQQVHSDLLAQKEICPQQNIIISTFHDWHD